MKLLLLAIVWLAFPFVAPRAVAWTDHKSAVSNGSMLTATDGIDYLAMLVHASSSGMVIIYSTNCSKDTKFVAPPNITINQFDDMSVTASNVLRILKSDASVSVSNPIENVLFVHLGDIPKSLLDTKLPVVRFTPIERYNPDVAITVLLNNSAVRRASEQIGVRLPVEFTESLVVRPGPGLPHLAAQFSNTTFGNMLGAVAVAFHGVVTYGVCEPAGLYNVNFYDGRGRQGAPSRSGGR